MTFALKPSTISIMSYFDMHKLSHYLLQTIYLKSIALCLLILTQSFLSKTGIYDDIDTHYTVLYYDVSVLD